MEIVLTITILVFLAIIIFQRILIIELKKIIYKYDEATINNYIKTILFKPFRFRNCFEINKQNKTEKEFEFFFNIQLEESKKELFKNIEPLIKIERKFIRESNSERVDLELIVYKNDKN